MEWLIALIVSAPVVAYVMLSSFFPKPPDLLNLVAPPVVAQSLQVTEAAAPPGISLDGLVMFYLEHGVHRPRPEDDLSPDQPLAPQGPQPSLLDLSEVLPLLPRFNQGSGEGAG